MTDLFHTENNGAAFSPCGKHRIMLWRIWDSTEPLVMFIGLNPSTANALEPDPTITRVKGFASCWGYGGFYMMNLFTFISTDPDKLDIKSGNVKEADFHLTTTANLCEKVVFAWGGFKVKGRDKAVKGMFPEAYALHINKDGSPNHPLYVKADKQLVRYPK